MKKQIRNSALALLLTAMLAGQAHAARLSIQPANGDFITGCDYRLNLIIDTQGINSLATDAFLFYNPDQIEILGNVNIGSVYEAYPGNIVGGGKIMVTAFNRGGYFNGRGVLGTINFRAKPGVQSSVITYQFTPGSTVDSNVANAESVDILSSVGNATLNFRDGSCPRPAAPEKPIAKPIVPPTAGDVIDLEAELAACKNALSVLEGLRQGDTGEKEYLCAEIGKLRPAAGYESMAKDFWSLLILLILSLILNLLLMTDLTGPKRAKIHFEKRPVPPNK